MEPTPSTYRVKNENELFLVRDGALVSDFDIPFVTQRLDDYTAYTYGHRFFIAKEMERSAAEIIAKLLGKELK